jgi:hypothetical protein
LFSFMQAVLSENTFNPDKVNQYCGA